MPVGHSSPAAVRFSSRVLFVVAVLSAVPGFAHAQTQPGANPGDGWLPRVTVAAAAGIDAGTARGFALPVRQVVATTPAEGSDETRSPAPSYHDYFSALGYSFTHGLAAREQLAPLAIGSAGTLVFLPIDQKVSDSLRGHATSLGAAGNVIGHPVTLGALSGGLILGSLATDNARFRGYAFTFSQGLIVAESLTAALKLFIRRERPDSSTKVSFPSGHAAGMFALAAVSSHYYGAKAGVPLYALASAVALSRVTSGKHFVSDVIFGATVGYISASAAIAGTKHVTSAAAGSRTGVGLGPRAISFYLRF